MILHKYSRIIYNHIDYEFSDVFRNAQVCQPVLFFQHVPGGASSMS